MKRRISDIGQTAALIAAAAVIMIKADTVARGIHSGIELCMTSVIPSLFAIMYISVIFVESGAAQRIGGYLAPVCRRVFDMPGEAGAAMLISVIGGYPAGAKAVCGLYRRGAISRGQAQRMALCCFCAGPAFIIGVIGGIVGRYGAMLLLTVQVVTVPIMGIVSRIFTTGSQERYRGGDIGEERSSVAQIIVSAARQTSSAMLMICVFVIVFSGVIELLEDIGAIEGISRLLTGVGIDARTADAIPRMLPEVTAGCASAASAGLPAVGFAIGFGGFAVHAQVLAICGEIGLRYPRFLLMRIMQGGISALLTWTAQRILPDIAAVSAPAADMASRSTTGAATLAVMCLMCMLCMPQIDKEGNFIEDRAFKY